MKLNQITIAVNNVEQSILFYQKLGLNLIVKSLPHYARFESVEVDTTFSLHQSDQGITPTTWLYFETEDVDMAVAQLISLGVEVSEMPEDKPWLWREARILDPDKHTIILYHAGDNRKNPPWRI